MKACIKIVSACFFLFTFFPFVLVIYMFLDIFQHEFTILEVCVHFPYSRYSLFNGFKLVEVV